MSEFIVFLQNQGVRDVDDLMANIEAFLENPELFFELTPDERQAFESRMDEALAVM